MATPEFVFELHACRWAELTWPPHRRDATPAVLVGRQLGTQHRRWDTVVIECDSDGLDERARFGEEHLDSDMLHVVRHAPPEWAWYRDALPDPGYPWRYVREAVHRAAERDLVERRKRNGRIELRRRWPYPQWFDRVIAIEHKPDLDASAAGALAGQLEHDIALGLADEVWLATERTDTAVQPALLEEMPVEAGIVAIDTTDLSAEVLWLPRQLDTAAVGTRILDRPAGERADRSAARFEYLDAAEKADLRRRIAERAYERGWRSAIETMRPDCRHFQLAMGTLTHEPMCAALDRAQAAAECTGRCPAFEPEPPSWRTRGWPIEGGPGRRQRGIYARQRERRR